MGEKVEEFPSAEEESVEYDDHNVEQNNAAEESATKERLDNTLNQIKSDNTT